MSYKVSTSIETQHMLRNYSPLILFVLFYQTIYSHILLLLRQQNSSLENFLFSKFVDSGPVLIMA